ncbi:MAG: C4-type zinc ribbon domain-containing protein [Bacteroidota bacterium]
MQAEIAQPKVVTDISEDRDSSVEEKLRALFNLQKIDSQIDRIRIVRGELPLEVQDLEDEIAGLETRISNFSEELTSLNDMIVEKNNLIVEANNLIKKYQSQLDNVRNNREFDSLNKEIEFQNLEIQLAEKRIKEFKLTLENKTAIITESAKVIEDKKNTLENKRKELDDIVAENEKEEEHLKQLSNSNEKIVEERLVTAYKRIRKNARNGLAVVPIQRDACGGCFNKIPPQRQLEIRMRKKVIVCEYCGRILVDAEIAGIEAN